MNKFSHKSGFTIIEVVLVLAIAGLIFLMVFLALPALQRSQRDTQRRDDLSGFSTQITNYQANNRGAIPTDWGKFLTNYMKQNGDSGEFVDPDGTAYTVAVSGWQQADGTYNPADGNAEMTSFNHTIHIFPGGKCDGEKIQKSDGSATRTVAFVYKLEGGGYFCGSNS